jgi:hypothetical protein
MDASVISVLLQRVERAERIQRRFTAVATCLVVAAVAAAIMGQARPVTQTIEAQEFVVKDASGTVRARLGASASGVSLQLSHDAGRASLVVSANKAQGAHLSLADVAGKIKGLVVLNQETVGVYLSPADATGVPHASRVVFEVQNHGTGGLAVYDQNGQVRALLGAIAEDGTSVAVIQNKEGAIAWKAP